MSLLEFDLPSEATQSVYFQAEPHIPDSQGSVVGRCQLKPTGIIL